MDEITWDEVRKGQLLIIRQNIPLSGPRKFYRIEWCGEVIEHEPRWTKIKHDGKTMTVLQKHGEEEILKCDKKTFNKYVKENYS